MAPPISNRWKTDPEYIDLLSYIVDRTKDVESPMNIQKMAREFKEKSGASLTVECLSMRIDKVRRRIHSFQHINKKTKVKMMFALSAPLNADFLEELEKNAIVEVDEKKRIIHYKANDGSLELRGDHSQSAKNRTAQFESKGSLLSMIKSYFENKNDADAIPKNENEKEIGNLIEFIIEKCRHINSPLSIQHLANDFTSRFGISTPFETIRTRVKGYCRDIQKMGFLDTHTKAQQLFGLSATIDSDYLETLRKEALVEVDEKNRITHYKANGGSLELRGDHSLSAKRRTANLESKRSLRGLIIDYFKNKNNADAVSKKEKKKNVANLIEFITEKCDNANSPLSIRQLARDFNEKFEISRAFGCIYRRLRTYCRVIQKTEFLDTQTKVKQLFGLSIPVDSDCLRELQKNAVVEVDHKNRIIKYTAIDGSLTLRGNHWGSKKTKPRRAEKYDSSDEYSSEEFGSEFNSDEENDHLDETEDFTQPSNEAVQLDNETPSRNRSSTNMSIEDNFDFDPPTERSHRSEKIEMRADGEKENGPENTRSKRRYSDLEDDLDEHCPEEFESDSEPESKDDDLDKSEYLREPSNVADDFDNETPARNHSSTNMSIDDNFDFDPPTERSHRSEEIEMREDEEKENDFEITENAGIKTRSGRLSKINSSTSHTPKTPKRKYDASYESNSTKRTKPPAEKSMNPIQIDDNVPHDDSSRIEIEPFRGPLGHPEGIEEDPDIQQIPRSRPQVMEKPIKKEYEEETQTSLKMVLKAFKSLILSLDTPALSQFQMELDKRIMETGRGVEVNNKEVILAMEFLILKLSKHSALKCSEDSISLRDILLMLRTIILNSSFTGLEVILEMLKENIEQLKVLDKKVPVSKVECVLRATLDNIST